MIKFRLKFHLSLFGAKPLSEPKMSLVADKYMRHSASVSQITSYNLIAYVWLNVKFSLPKTVLPGTRSTNDFLLANSNSMETSPCCYSIAGPQIVKHLYPCHDSTVVVPCTKFCSDHFVGIEGERVKQNFHRIWIAMEKPLLKRGPGPIIWFSPYYHSSVFHLHSLDIPHVLYPKCVDQSTIWPSHIGCTQHWIRAEVFDNHSRYIYQNTPRQRSRSELPWYHIPPLHHVLCVEQMHVLNESELWHFHRKSHKTHTIYTRFWFSLFCVGYDISYSWFHVIHVPVFFRVASLTLNVQNFSAKS